MTDPCATPFTTPDDHAGHTCHLPTGHEDRCRCWCGADREEEE